MNSWYTIKVKYIKEFTDGTLKRVTEPYLVNSLSFTEAEARIYREVGEYVRGEFLVTSIVKTDYADIFEYDDTDTYFKAKVVYVSEDADSGSTKSVNNTYLVAANTVKEAYERIEEGLRGLMTSYEIPSVAVTPLIAVFPYEPTEDEGEEGAVEQEDVPASPVPDGYPTDEEAPTGDTNG